MSTGESAAERSIKPQNKFEKTYVIDGEPVTVTWKEFIPKSGIKSSDLATFMLPGWSASDAKTLEELAQGFADQSGGKAYSVTTKARRVLPDSLFTEAQAICELVQEKNIKEVIFAGHSAGGSKAADAVVITQTEYPDTQIKGLIMIDPVGLYNQSEAELAAKFAWDSVVSTPFVTIPAEAIRHPLVRKAWKHPSRQHIKAALTPDILLGTRQALSASFDIARNIPKQLPPNRLWNQIKEMAAENTRLREVACPVVLIQGAGDPISSPQKTVTDQEARQLWSTRRKFLKEVRFPNSPDVSMLVAKRFPRHGLPHFRPEEVAKTSLYLLNRHKESKGPNINPESKFIKK